MSTRAACSGRRRNRPWLSMVSVILVTSGGVAGCSLPGPQDRPATATYILQADGSTAAAGLPAGCLTLQVAAVQAAPGYATSRMAYMSEPPRLDYFAYHRWADRPSRLLETVIRGRIEESQLVRAVLPATSNVEPDLRLHTELRQLRQDFSGGKSYVLLEVMASMIDAGERRLLDTRQFDYTETAVAANPAAGATATNRAVNRLLDDLVGFLQESIETIDCPVQQ